MNLIPEPMVTENVDSTDWLVAPVILNLQLNFDLVNDLQVNGVMEACDRHLKLLDDVFGPMTTLMLIDEHFDLFRR